MSCVYEVQKCHSLKFQSVLIPDGFIACLYGPVPAKTHDARLLCESQLLEQLQTVMPEDGNTPIYALYGDLAYAQSAYVLGGFHNVDMNSDEAAYNRLLSSVPITVEKLHLFIIFSLTLVLLSLFL